MKSTSLPKYYQLGQALNQTTLKLHPSQVHGLICGILCGHPSESSAWENLVTGDQTTGKTHELLQELYNASASLLKDFLIEFHLILPADSQKLPQRAEALTLWCQGFLTGLKLVNVPIVNREPNEITEAINDIIEIAKMNYEEVVASEEDEAAYIELVEFIRVAVILIYQDLQEANEPPQPSYSSGHLH
ncbi:MAG: hypothetical protein A3F11_08750 [Gammaproteobacteria bacterium RIFCSPHIGHO2_12_FULL_37_14]|nr:MAG: hypothetical protein A3F11_08750 [Gammaproteobacteria bacterium RIFCSPHIGHO2_12_FULL_37_14]